MLGVQGAGTCVHSRGLPLAPSGGPWWAGGRRPCGHRLCRRQPSTAARQPALPSCLRLPQFMAKTIDRYDNNMCEWD